MEARELLANLSHPDGSIRHKATLALGSCGRVHRAWAPDLIDAVAAQNRTPGPPCSTASMRSGAQARCALPQLPRASVALWRMDPSG